ncbi:MAG TPA: molybdopterin oxidoreductase family protein [Armatimonadota bacterium]
MVKRTVCPHDCPDTCGILATVEGGRVTRVQGDPSHSFTAGFLCHKVDRYEERVHSPHRILTPLRRIGAKGEGRFDPVSWDAALRETSERLLEARDTWGGEAILPVSYGGTLGLVNRNYPHRLFHALGASQLDRNICDAAGEAAWQYTYGDAFGSDPEGAAESDLILIWGMNAAVTNLHFMPFVRQAQKRGARLWVVDVYRNATARMADEFVQVRPGTDAALALGVMRVLFEEGLADEAWALAHTVGFPELKAKVLEEYPLPRCAQDCGVPEERIRELGRAYGRARAPYLRIGIGFQRRRTGGMALRAVSCLPALVGAWDTHGGGALFECQAAADLDLNVVRRPDLMPGPCRTLLITRLGEALCEVGGPPSPLPGPPVKAAFVYHSNPAAVCPDQARVLRGLAREDLFTVVHEQFRTDTTDWADIVFPATTSFETSDLYRSYGHYYLQLSEQVVPPVGEARSNVDLCRALAEAMDLPHPALRETTEEVVEALLSSGGDSPYLEGITPESLRAKGAHRLQVPRTGNPLPARLNTPSGKIELYSERMASEGLPPLPEYVADPEGPSAPEARAYPLQLISPPARHLLNTTFGSSERLVEAQGRPELQMHPTDAQARGLHDGQRVRVHNQRGSCDLWLKLTETTQKGVVIAEGVWWPKHSPGGRGINQLTTPEVADMGQGCALHSCLVEVQAA